MGREQLSIMSSPTSPAFMSHLSPLSGLSGLSGSAGSRAADRYHHTRARDSHGSSYGSHVTADSHYHRMVDKPYYARRGRTHTAGSSSGYRSDSVDAGRGAARAAESSSGCCGCCRRKRAGVHGPYHKRGARRRSATSSSAKGGFVVTRGRGDPYRRHAGSDSSTDEHERVRASMHSTGTAFSSVLPTSPRFFGCFRTRGAGVAAISLVLSIVGAMVAGCAGIYANFKLEGSDAQPGYKQRYPLFLEVVAHIVFCFLTWPFMTLDRITTKSRTARKHGHRVGQAASISMLGIAPDKPLCTRLRMAMKPWPRMGFPVALQLLAVAVLQVISHGLVITAEGNLGGPGPSLAIRSLLALAGLPLSALFCIVIAHRRFRPMSVLGMLVCLVGSGVSLLAALQSPGATKSFDTAADAGYESLFLVAAVPQSIAWVLQQILLHEHKAKVPEIIFLTYAYQLPLQLLFSVAYYALVMGQPVFSFWQWMQGAGECLVGATVPTATCSTALPLVAVLIASGLVFHIALVSVMRKSSAVAVLMVIALLVPVGQLVLYLLGEADFANSTLAGLGGAAMGCAMYASAYVHRRRGGFDIVPKRVREAGLHLGSPISGNTSFGWREHSGSLGTNESHMTRRHSSIDSAPESPAYRAPAPPRHYASHSMQAGDRRGALLAIISPPEHAEAGLGASEGALLKPVAGPGVGVGGARGSSTSLTTRAASRQLMASRRGASSTNLPTSRRSSSPVHEAVGWGDRPAAAAAVNLRHPSLPAASLPAASLPAASPTDPPFPAGMSFVSMVSPANSSAGRYDPSWIARSAEWGGRDELRGGY